MPAETKHLALITGTRAEYGLLRPVILKLLKSDKITLSVIATGAHLSPEYGNTVSEIEADGVPIAARLDILRFGHGQYATADTMADTIVQFSRWFGEHKPDAVLVLGDRYEIFAACIAAAQQGVPIAHISGGDVTLGAADDYYRHCITKMAALHFPSCEDSTRRVLRLGEQPDSVFNVGGLGDENIRILPKLTLPELEDSLSDFCKNRGQQPLPITTAPFALVTFHPETAGGVNPEAQMTEMLAGMELLNRRQADSGEPETLWLITKANADAGGERINALIDRWAAQRPGSAAAFTSLGVRRYLSAMSHAALVAGNSSSGVVETPTFGVPTVNVGNRQAGRLLCPNVISCPAERGAIAAALAEALTPAFAAKAHETVSPYNGGDTSGRIVAILEQKLFELGFGAPKKFYDGE